MRAALKQRLASGARRRVLLLLPVIVLLSGGATWAAFSSSSSNAGNSITAASDFAAPTISPETAAKSQGGSVGFIKQGGAYYVYANVTDSGNPPSGVATVTADVSNISAGQTSVPLAAGSFTVGGTTYNRRSAQLTANLVLLPGAKGYTISAADNGSNSGSVNGSVVVDNIPPIATDVQAVNQAGGQAGKAEAGDTLTYTFLEDIEPESILAGWAGASQSVTVRLNNAGNLDTLTVYDQANIAQLPFGTVALNGNHVTGNRTVPSTMTMSGATVQIVLGTPSGNTRRENTAAAMIWTPSSTPYDRAANAMLPTPATEAVPLDVEF